MESKVGGDEAVHNAGIQTDGTLALIKGVTVTLHMNAPHEDLELRADFEREGQAGGRKG